MSPTLSVISLLAAVGLMSVAAMPALAIGVPGKDIDGGKTVMVGFVLHAGHSARRFHDVSFEQSLASTRAPAISSPSRNKRMTNLLMTQNRGF